MGRGFVISLVLFAAGWMLPPAPAMANGRGRGPNRQLKKTANRTTQRRGVRRQPARQPARGVRLQARLGDRGRQAMASRLEAPRTFGKRIFVRETIREAQALAQSGRFTDAAHRLIELGQGRAPLSLRERWALAGAKGRLANAAEKAAARGRGDQALDGARASMLLTPNPNPQFRQQH